MSSGKFSSGKSILASIFDKIFKSCFLNDSNLSDFNGESHNIRFVDSNLNTSLQVLKYDNNQISRTGYFIGDSLLSVENIAP